MEGIEFSRHRIDADLVLLALTVLLGKAGRTVRISERIIHTWPAFPGSVYNMAEYTLITGGVRAGDCIVTVHDARLLPAVRSWQEHLPEKNT